MTETVPAGTPAPAQAEQRQQGGHRPSSQGRGGSRPRRTEPREEGGLKETVVTINRVSKTVKGGKRFSFSALVVVGDGAGTVGVGLGKAREVQSAIQKGNAQARKSLVKFPVVKDTIPHEVQAKYRSGVVWMKPASTGTGVIAGGGVRAVLEAAGVKNILTKSLGSSNPFNVVGAALECLRLLRTPEDVVKLRGK